MVKVIHCADIHLDSPFTLSDPRDAELRRMELRATFTSLVMYARNNGTKVFLIAGDLFDDIHVSRETAAMLIREFSSFPDCRFFITPGNHDWYHSKSPYKLLKWPDNVHIFRAPELTRVEMPDLNVDVYGYAFTAATMTTNPFAGKKPYNPSRINILVGHGDTSAADSPYCPVTRADIERGGFDYYALGHIHNGTDIIKVGQSALCFPGCLEGRGFDELGYKGAMAGEIDKGDCRLKGVRFSKKRYEIAEVDITDLDSEFRIVEKIRRDIAQFKEDTALRVVLTGTMRSGFILNPNFIESQLTGPHFVQVVDSTLPYIDYKTLKEDKGLRGIFYRKLEPLLESADERERETARLAIRYGLSAFSGINIIDF